MKVLIVNTLDFEGGAARASYRLHQALLAEGIDSQMLVQKQASDDFTVIGPRKKVQKALGVLRPILDNLRVLSYKDRTKTLFSVNWLPFSSVVKYINSMKPDVVHLNWIAGGMIRIEDIGKIKAPIIWSLHDMWAFTGGCHYDEECRAYKKQCGACPVLGSNKLKDLSHKVWLRKQETFSKMTNLNIIGLSKWLADCAKQSSLLKDNPVFNLPNPINTYTFSPFDKQQARALFNLPQDKKLVLFGSLEATGIPRKGFKELSKALMQLDIDNTELVVFGSSRPKIPQGFKQKAHYIGRLHDDISLRVLYSAAHVTVVPSLQEAFGQTASESMACGTPVVAFAATGLLDIVDHLDTGYLAKPFETNDLARGIEWVLTAPNYSQLCQNAREKVLQEFDSQVVAKKYIDLYNQIINGAV